MRQSKTGRSWQSFWLAMLVILCACGRQSADVQRAIATGIAGTQQANNQRATAMAATVQAARATLAVSSPPAETPLLATLAPTPETLDMFATRLEKAISNRNYEALRPLLADDFTLTTWRLEGATWSGDQMIEQLRGSLLASSRPISFTTDLPATVLGTWTNSETTRHLFSTGWGRNGKGEALLVLKKCPSGTFCWAEAVIAPTSFKAVQGAFLAATSVNNSLLRLGPGKLYDAAGRYPKDTQILVLGILPGMEWVNVNTPDGKNGWMGVSILNLTTVLGNLPLYEGEPEKSFHFVGRVEDTAGKPVNGVTVYISPETNTNYWTEATSDEQGEFHAWVPANIGKAWIAMIAAYTCQSRAVDANCRLVGGFNAYQASLQAPQSSPLIFVYNPDMPATPVP